MADTSDTATETLDTSDLDRFIGVPMSVAGHRASEGQ